MTKTNGMTKLDEVKPRLASMSCYTTAGKPILLLPVRVNELVPDAYYRVCFLLFVFSRKRVCTCFSVWWGGVRTALCYLCSRILANQWPYWRTNGFPLCTIITIAKRYFDYIAIFYIYVVGTAYACVSVRRGGVRTILCCAPCARG